jgi:hypothetical protein
MLTHCFCCGFSVCCIYQCRNCLLNTCRACIPALLGLLHPCKRLGGRAFAAPGPQLDQQHCYADIEPTTWTVYLVRFTKSVGEDGEYGG